MARIPANPNPTPTPQGEPSNEQLQAAATELNLDFDAMSDEERAFVAVYATGGLASIDAQNGDNPLIPDATEDVASTDDDGATATDVEDVDVRVGTEASDDGGVPGDPESTAVPSTPPPAEPIAAVPEVVMIDLGGGVQMPRDQVLAQLQAAAEAQAQPNITQEEANMLALRRQGLVDYTFVDPKTGQAVVPGQPAPTTQPPEWIDDAAQQAFAAQQQQLSELAQSQRQLLERTVIADQQAIESAITDSTLTFTGAHGLAEPEAQEVMETLRVSGILPAYRDRFPGDPRQAMTSALEAVYWNMPKFRDREIQKAIAANAAANVAVDEKKAANAGIASSPGSVARTAPTNPKNRDEANAAIVGLIEADASWQSRNGAG